MDHADRSREGRFQTAVDNGMIVQFGVTEMGFWSACEGDFFCVSGVNDYADCSY